MSSTDQSELAKTLGNQLFKEKKYNGALEQYAKAIEFNPNNHILYSNQKPFVTIDDDDQLFNSFKTNYSEEEYQTIIDDVLQIEEITNPYYKAQCYIMLSKAMIQMNNSDYREYIEKSISIYPLQEAMNILENKQI
ncbi:hypothetical protein QTN25_005229 [Entamoeba marina]